MGSNFFAKKTYLIKNGKPKALTPDIKEPNNRLTLYFGVFIGLP